MQIAVTATATVTAATSLLVLLSLFPLVYASGPREDYDERYKDIPGAIKCWINGYDDGLNHPFNHERNEECGPDKGDQYYRAFIHGCKDAGNSEETCERFTTN